MAVLCFHSRQQRISRVSSAARWLYLPQVRTRFQLSHAALPGQVPEGAALLVGVSGGRDSVALLHWLHGVAEPRRRLVVCHLDHGLRASSGDEAEFVGRCAAGLGCAFRGERVDVGDLARRTKRSLETAGRAARRAFFARCAGAEGTNFVVLGHHADDQVETFLFHLLRGAGPGGLGGMSAFSAHTVDGVSLKVVRPLLGVWRAGIDAYVAAHGLAFREDASNADPRHTRNRIRHGALPALAEALGHDARAALWRAGETLRAEDEFVAGELAKLGEEELGAKVLAALPLALQRRWILRWLHRGGVASAGFGEVEAVRGLLPGGRLAKVNLPGGKCARRQAGRIFLAEQ